MKKIVMGLATVAMATAMFAAEPTINPSVAEYKGDASVTWGISLENGKSGFENGGSQSIKVDLFSAGDKATSGDGIWADIKIKNDAIGAWSVPSVTLDHAMFHIYDVYVGITEGNTKVAGSVEPTTAIQNTSLTLGEVGPAQTQGITIGYDCDYVKVEADFRSTKAVKKYTNDYAIASQIELKEIAGFSAKAGIAYEFNNSNSFAYAANAAYKLALGDNYLKIMGGYTSAKDMVAGVIFAWGAEKDNDLPYFVSGGKVNPGVGVVFDYDLGAESWACKINPSFYLGDFVENLKFGAKAPITINDDNTVSYSVAADVAYDIKADKVTYATKAGVSYGTALNVKAGVDVSGVLDNATFSVEWVSGDLLNGKAGTLDFTAKISL